ncbi:hypothetical protein AOLI_G00092420 [Acnodon oligacanthus]
MRNDDCLTVFHRGSRHVGEPDSLQDTPDRLRYRAAGLLQASDSGLAAVAAANRLGFASWGLVVTFLGISSHEDVSREPPAPPCLFWADPLC